VRATALARRVIDSVGRKSLEHLRRTWLACTANHTVIPAKAGTYAAWVPAFAGMTMLSRG